MQHLDRQKLSSFSRHLKTHLLQQWVSAASYTTDVLCVVGRPFVKRFALFYRTVVCPLCPVLSVTMVYCGQTVRWIRMPLGTEVGLGPGDIVLDGDPGLSPPKWAQQPPLFRPCLLWPNGRPSQRLLSSCCDCLSEFDDYKWQDSTELNHVVT